MKGNGGLKLQSAIEYLTTYGWMILVVSVALASLFYLGVFNPQNFQPKTASGSCYVNRPQGPNTTYFISLAGECSNALPKYAATFNGNANIVIPYQYYLYSNSISVTFWVWESGAPSQRTVLGINGNWGIFGAYGSCGGGPSISANLGPGSVCYGWQTRGWHFVAVTYDRAASKEYLYINGTQVASASGSRYGRASAPLVIGSGSGAAGFNGMLANLQIYNTTLSANDVEAQYLGGIGGDPIDVQGITAWYQLNGDAIDWSGNQNNGAPSGMGYTEQWNSNYTVP